MKIWDGSTLRHDYHTGNAPSHEDWQVVVGQVITTQKTVTDLEAAVQVLMNKITSLEAVKKSEEVKVIAPKPQAKDLATFGRALKDL